MEESVHRAVGSLIEAQTWPSCQTQEVELMGRKPALTPEQLEEVIKLYVEQQKGSEDIAPLFACSGNTILNSLKKAGIKIRGKSDAVPSKTRIGDKFGDLEVIELLESPPGTHRKKHELRVRCSCDRELILTTVQIMGAHPWTECKPCKLKKEGRSITTNFPDIAKEAYGWDPSTEWAGSAKKVKWICSEGHIYEAAIVQRINLGSGCPYCAMKAVIPGETDLLTRFPDIAKEAHGWDPSQIMPGSDKKLEWKCSENHIYIVSPSRRTGAKKEGCPYCSGHKVLIGFNDLSSKFPDIAAEAHNWDPQSITCGSPTKREWKCQLGHIFKQAPSARTGRGAGCPYCSGRYALAGFNDLATINPELAKEADGWDPTTVTAGKPEKRAWKCSKCGHQWRAVIASRNSGVGCSKCAEYGYDTTKDAWMYLMRRPGEQQFGISNVIKERLATHRREGGWQLLEYIGPFKGDDVYMCEVTVKKWLNESIGTTPGHEENWFTTNLEVQSLKELFDASGISNDFRLPTQEPTYK